MLRRRPTLRAASAIGLVVAVGALVGCDHAKLDAQMQSVAARECASLLERHITGATPPAKITLNGVTLDLGGDPSAFYERLQALRGPDAFPSGGPGYSSTETRAGVISDKCKTGSSAATKPGAPTTTTTTTTEPLVRPGPGG